MGVHPYISGKNPAGHANIHATASETCFLHLRKLLTPPSSSLGPAFAGCNIGEDRLAVPADRGGQLVHS